MNLLGIIKAGLAAGLLINLSQYSLNTMVLQVPRETMTFWVAYGFALGFLVAWFYAWMLTRGWDSGARTAILAGGIMWFVVGGLNAAFMGYHVIGMFWTLADMVVAGILAGGLYREPEALPAGDSEAPGPTAGRSQDLARPPDLLGIPGAGRGLQESPVRREVLRVAVHRFPVEAHRFGRIPRRRFERPEVGPVEGGSGTLPDEGAERFPRGREAAEFRERHRADQERPLDPGTLREDGGGPFGGFLRLSAADAQLGEPGGRFRIPRVRPEHRQHERLRGIPVAAFHLDLRRQQQRLAVLGERGRPALQHRGGVLRLAGAEQQPGQGKGEHRRAVPVRGSGGEGRAESGGALFRPSAREGGAHERVGAAPFAGIEGDRLPGDLERPVRILGREEGAGAAREGPRVGRRRRSEGPEGGLPGERLQGRAVSERGRGVDGEGRPELQDRMVVPVAGRLGGPRVERGTRRGEPGAERAETGDPVGGEFAGQPDDALLDDRLRRGGERAPRADQQRVAVVQHEERGLGKTSVNPPTTVSRFSSARL